MEFFVDITVVQAVLIGLWSAFCLAGQLLGIYSNRALVISFGIGCILGDVPTALAFGAMAELAFMGFGVGPGGSVPPNPLGPGVVGTIMAITMKDAGVDPATAFALSYPFAIAFQFVITATYTAASPIPEGINRAIESGSKFKFKLYANATIISFVILGFAIGFLGAASTPLLEMIVGYIPEWLMNGLTIAGGLLPAIGFALILSMMMKKEFIGYAILGYFVSAYMGIPVMGIAIIAAAFATMDLFRTNNNVQNDVQIGGEQYADGI